MKRSIALARQAGNPTGLFGRFIATVMSFETRNANNLGLNLLKIEEDDRVLEVGFGHGKTIKTGSGKIQTGLFAGIDISETMLVGAKKTNQAMIKKGIVELKLADVDEIPYLSKGFFGQSWLPPF